jgi:hypothetical protein
MGFVWPLSFGPDGGKIEIIHCSQGPILPHELSKKAYILPNKKGSWYYALPFPD